MKYLIVMLLVTGFLTAVEGQNVTYTMYSNYEFGDGRVIWTKIFERPGITIDSLRTLILYHVSNDIAMEIFTSQESELNLKMNDKTFEKNGDKLTALIKIDLKPEKYRVTIQGVSRKMGIKTMRTARVFGVAAEVGDYNGTTFEDDFVNKAGTGFKTGQANLRGMDYFNSLFEAGFNFKAASARSKDDW